MKGEKHIASIDFTEYLRTTNVSENIKVIMGDFYKMDFMKGNI